MAPMAFRCRPAFNTNILSLADRGFVYAIAHIRGGKDKGYGWYKAGKMMTKKNTFKDFIAAGASSGGRKALPAKAISWRKAAAPAAC